MNQYFFALGTNHTLSKIDIVNTLLRKGVEFEILEASEEMLIIAVNGELDVHILINELGSAAKIGEILKEDIKENLEEVLKEKIGVGAEPCVCPIKFGISVYGAGGKYQEIDKIFRRVKGEPAFAKATAGEGRILSTVEVDKNKLLTGGIELVICVGSKGVYLGKTLAVQDYENYSLRDYGRPSRDDKSGMIPPKLAKMMINLCGKNKDDALLDPFCGSGTFLQEMLLLGYKNIIGTDVEEKAISDTNNNLEWLKRGFFVPLSGTQNDTQVKLIKSDARTLSSKIPYKSIDAIISEPFLGSAKRRNLFPEDIKKEIEKLEELYVAVFKEFTKLLKDNGKIVIIFPIFRFKDQFFKLEILEKIKQFGFVPGKFIGQEIVGEEKLKLQITERNSVVFFRPGQSVSREIFVSQKA